MKLLSLSLIALSSLAASAFADLGDTITSSEAKYGKGTPDQQFRHRIMYDYNDWWVFEFFNDAGMCVYM